MDRCTFSEAFCVMELSKMGYEIGVPVHHSQSYDLIFRRSKKEGFKTIQVKTAFPVKRVRNDNTLRVCLKTKNKHHNYEKGDYDYLFVANCKDYWVMPFKDVKSKHDFIVTTKRFEKYKNNMKFIEK
jgi:hypothetical protein